MTEINKIFDDINNKNGKPFSEENELFEEFNKLNDPHSDNELQNENRMIDFLPYSGIENNKGTKIVKLAADSGDKFSNKLLSQEFLISANGEIALKYKIVNMSVLQIVLLSSNIERSSELILYSRKLDKYFISNLNGDYIIGQYDQFKLTDFEFQAIMPFDKIKLIKVSSGINAFPTNDSKVLITYKSDQFTQLDIQTSSTTIVAIIITSKTKDSLKVSGNLVEIPNVLLENNSLIYLY